MAAQPPAEEPPRRQSLGISGYWNLAKDGYEQLVQAIIRPPRAEYEIAELGPEQFTYGGVEFIREDMQIQSPRGLRLDASLWRPLRMPEEGKPCVMYMHGNASCRAEALTVLAPVLSTGAIMFAFDFAGCGRSEGEYISLGWFERDDCAACIDHLRSLHVVTAIALWGRSMGAGSAVMQASRDPSLAGLILDSPFSNFEAVAMELVAGAQDAVPNVPSIPPFLARTALRVVASSVHKRAGFDLYKLRPVDCAPTCFIPALFATAHDDVLVRPHHSQQAPRGAAREARHGRGSTARAHSPATAVTAAERGPALPTLQIYDAYAGDKNIVTFEGDHNEMRPGFFSDSACIFLKVPPTCTPANAPAPGHGRRQRGW